MLPFSFSLKSGVPIYDQVVYAVRRAVVTGQLRTGDEFPSVRALSQELRLSPISLRSHPVCGRRLST